MKLILPSVLLLLATGCSGEDTAEVAASTEGSTTTSSSSDDGPDLSDIADATLDDVGRMSRELLEDTTAALKGVTDSDSARAARTVLEEIAERVEPLRKRRDELTGSSAANKMQFGQDMLAMMGQITALSGEFERLDGIAGVREELEAVMQKITGFFDAR